MNYTVFDNESDYPVTLTKQEIYQPFDALRSLLADTTSVQWQRDLDELVMAVLKTGKWKALGPPIYLHQKTQKIIKLVEILWFINHCFLDDDDLDFNPDYEERTRITQYLHRSFPEAFVQTPDDSVSPSELDAYAALAMCLYEYPLVSYRYTLVRWLSTALNASYMGNLNTDYLLSANVNIKDYRLLSWLIDLAHDLKPKAFTASGYQKRSFYQIFANNYIDYPATLGYTEIEDPLSNLYYPFCYIRIDRVPKILNQWYEMLNSTDHWLNHNDPGNVHFIHEKLVEIMEIAWLLVQQNYRKSFVLIKPIPEVDPVFINELNTEDRIYPFRLIKRFFKIRSLREWKHLLAEWLNGSLTDQKESTLLEVITASICQQLIQLTQVAYLIHKQYKNK